MGWRVWATYYGENSSVTMKALKENGGRGIEQAKCVLVVIFQIEGFYLCKFIILILM